MTSKEIIAILESYKSFEDNRSEDLLHHGYDNTKASRKRKEALDEAIKALSVTERARGEWVLKQRGKFVDIVCSKCEYVRVKDYAYNYTIEEIEKEFNENNTKPNFCECCGADMRGGKE